MRRLLCSALVLLVGCAHAQPSGEYEAPLPVLKPISPEAAALFARADTPDAAGSLIVDFDEMRARGLIGPSKAGRSAYVDLMIGLLAGGAPYFKEDATGPLLTRAAVMVGLLRAWNAWPSVQRAGIIVPTLKGNPVQNVLLALAVPYDAATNLELIRGIGAIDRATGKPYLALQKDGRLCVSLGKEIESKVGDICVSAGPGYLVLASSLSMVDPKQSPVTAAAPPPPFFVRLRVSAPFIGHGEVIANWSAGFHLGVDVTPGTPGFAEKLHAALTDGLKKLDDNHAQVRAGVDPVLAAAKIGIAQDADAPGGLKTAAAAVTLDSLLDPDGTYQAWRQSIHIDRAGDHVTATATLPEKSFRKALKQYDLLTVAAVVGVLAAVAIPNFTKYQARAKQSEVKSTLKTLYRSQRAVYEEKNAYAKTFDALHFTPEAGTKYSYCMAGKCVACTAADCYQLPPAANRCIQMTKEYANDDGSEGFLICAVGDPDGKRSPESVDIWTITEDGKAQHVSSDSGSDD